MQYKFHIYHYYYFKSRLLGYIYYYYYYYYYYKKNNKITLFIDSKKIDYLQIQEYEY